MLFRRTDIGPSLAKAVLACVAITAALNLGGCASTAAPTGGTALKEVGPATLPPATGADVGASAAGRATFATLDTAAATRLIIERLPSSTTGAADYTQKRFLVEGGKETLIRELHLRLRDDGAIVLVEEINQAESVEVVFEPPLVVFPAAVKPQTTTTSEGRMTVHPLGDRSKVRAKGTVKDMGLCEGAFHVSTPAGEFDAWKLKGTFEADLGASHVLNETELWVVPGIGIIAERRREKTTVLGVAIRSNAESWVIVEAPAAATKPKR